MRARQRGGAPIFLIFALALATGVGVLVYQVMKERRRDAAIAEATAPRPMRSPPPEPVPEPPPPMESPPTPGPVRQAQVDPPASDKSIVAFGTPGIDGALDPAHVEQVVKTQRGKFERCLIKAADQQLGVLSVMLIVEPDGTLRMARITVVGDGRFEACVEEGLRRLRFDPADRSTSIVYPIRFWREAAPDPIE